MSTIISHSEVESFLQCERKHLYAHGYKVAPRQIGDGLYRGTIFHSIMRGYFSAWRATGRISDAKRAGESAFDAAFISKDNRPAQLILLGNAVTKWYDWFEQTEARNWTPVEIEAEYRLQLDDEFVYPFTVDLVMSDHRRNGDLAIWDHKCLYNFYTDDDIAISPQLPKYMGGMRALGIQVSEAYYNMLRWRKDAKETVKLARVRPSNDRVRRTFLEQVRTAEKIKQLKELPFEQWDDIASRTMNSYNCKNCGMKPLCVAQLNGASIKNMLQVEYQPNTYGYSEEKSE